MANSSYIDILFTALGGIDGSVMPPAFGACASAGDCAAKPARTRHSA